MPIRESSIRDLAAFKGEDAPVTSLYLDVDGRRRIRARNADLDVAGRVGALLRY